MKNIILSGIALAAFAFASPALAAPPPSGVVGGVVGDINIGNVHITNSNTMSLSIDDTLTASSGSGFAGSLTVNPNYALGTSSANFNGSGNAWSVAGGITGSLGPISGGLAGSESNSAGNFTASTTNYAAVSGQVMNFGQSEFTRSFTLDVDHSDSFKLNDSWLDGYAVGGFVTF